MIKRIPGPGPFIRPGLFHAILPALALALTLNAQSWWNATGTASWFTAWTPPDDTQIAYINNGGTAVIVNGQAVSKGGYIAQSTTSSGGVIVGAGGHWNMGANNFFVGNGTSSRGTLTIANTGTVKNSGGYLGYSATSTGSATVAGVWDNTGNLMVGTYGNGVLTIESTGTVKNAEGRLGYAAAATGTATVAGLWDNAGALMVGYSCSGALVISATGTVKGTVKNTGIGYIGYSTNSSGTVYVAGLWESGGVLNIGNGTDSKGVLTIASSGTVKSGAGNSFISNGTNSSGTVYVAGVWETQERLYVGYTGTGALTIAETGTMKAGTAIANNTYIGYNTNSSGSAYVAGVWAIAGWNFYLGVQTNSKGALTIAETGTVNSIQTYIGYTAANASGTVRVAGVWNNTNNLYVGNTGPGALTIARTGTVKGVAAYMQNANSSLDVELDSARTTPYITAQSATLTGGTLTVTVDGVSGRASDFASTPRTLIRTTAAAGITGAFASVSGPGISNAGDYLAVSGAIDGKDYNVTAGLRWLAADAAARHGTFTLAAGDTFEVDIALPDTTGNAGWDGKSLVKSGTGLLILSAANTYTGTTTVAGGTLRLAHLGAGSGPIVNNAALELAASSGTLTGAISGAGAITIAPGAAVTLRGNNSGFTGSLVIGGDAGITNNNQLGAAAVPVRIDAGGRLTTSASTFVNALTGGGALAASAVTGGVFGLDAAAGAAFAGTLSLAGNTALRLGTGYDANTALLTNGAATLRLDAGGSLRVNNAPAISNLTLNGGALWLAMNGDAPANDFAVTGTLSIPNPGASTIVFENYTPGGGGGGGGPVANWLDADTGSGNSTLLVRVGGSLAQPPPLQLAITDASGTPLTGQDVAYGDLTATYNYAAFTAATGSAGAGIYYDYVLTALAVGGGGTLAFTDAGASDSVFIAAIAGPGAVTFSTGSAITLAGANIYTGPSAILSGTLRAGADNALGQTSALTLAPGAAFELNGKAQAVGAIAAAAGSRLDLGAGALTVGAGGGSIAAALSSAPGASLNLGGLVDIAGANPAFAAAVRVTGTTVLHDARALGSTGTATIPAGGSLELNLPAAAAQTLGLTLAGEGAFVKTGGGTATISKANPAYSGAAGVEAGRLVLGDPQSLGTGTASVAAGAALEYTGAGALSAAVTGAGSFTLSSGGGGGTVFLEQPLTVASTEFKDTVVEVRAANVLASTSVRADASTIRVTAAAAGARLGAVVLNSSALHLAAANAVVGPVALSSGTFRIAETAANARLGAVTLGAASTLGFSRLAAAPAAGAGLRQAVLAGLSGNGGTLEFNADFTGVSGLPAPGAAADFLTITGPSSGAHTVLVYEAPGSALPSGGETAIPLIADAAGSAVYQLPGGKIDLGLMAFSLAKGAEADSPFTLDPGTWYLIGVAPSVVASTIINTNALLDQDWLYSLDALHLRMGGVRAEFSTGAAAERTLPTGNIWMRGRGHRLNAANAATGRGFEEYAYGLGVGGDRAFFTENGASLLGAFVDMGSIDRDFGGANESRTRNAAVGVYGTVMSNRGWHLDLVLKADRYKHRLTAFTSSGRPVRGLYNSNAAGLSLEAGHRLETGGWWLEPGAQIAAVRVGGAHYRTEPGLATLDVRVDTSTALQYRGLLRFGRRPADDSKWTPYGKIALARMTSNGGDIHAHDQSFSPDFDGGRFELGVGVARSLGDNGQLYLDYDYGKASSFERPWSLNLGFRRFW
jgi:outer membrane autotransporter protein